MARYPDSVQRFNCSSDNIPGVACWRVQYFCGHVAVIGLVDGERGGFDERRYVPAVLTLTPQLLGRALRVLTDRLAELIVIGDTLTEAATADNLLFRRRRFFQRYTGLFVQLSHRTFQNHVKILTDKGRTGQRQLQGCGNPHEL